MAITLQLTDGTTTVDFNDGSTLTLASAFQMNVFSGVGSELVICGWVGTTTANTKASTMRSALKLFRKAQRSARLNDVSQWVWLAWKPDDQTNTQYARVLGGGFAEVTSDVIGARGSGVWTVDVLRQGDWWDRVPNTAFGVTSSGSDVSGTVYNKSDADGDNWLSFAARDGDLPALLEINLDPDQDFTGVTIATKAFDDVTQANLFNPHFNVADRFTGGTTSADTAAPDDLKIAITGTTTITWQIPAANLEAYFGRYQVWAWADLTGGGSGDLTVAVSTPAKTNPAVAATSTNIPSYLGVIEIPGTDAFPLRATETVYSISLICTIAGSGTGDIYGFWLVPVDGDVLRLEHQISIDYTVHKVNVNGNYEVSYVERPDLGGTPTYDVDYAYPLVVHGTYPRLEPDRYTRLYFWFEDAGGAAPASPTVYRHNDSVGVRVAVTDRYTSLRGAT